MIFAPTIGLILIIFVLVRLFALLLLIYLIYFVIRCFFDKAFLQRVKSRPTIQTIKLLLFIGIIALSAAEYSYTSKIMAEVDRKVALEQKKLNPTLETATQIGELLLPAGTQLTRYQPDEQKFISATFPQPFTFKGLQIDYLENPNDKDATIRLHQAASIDGFLCQSNHKIRLDYSHSHLRVRNCLLAKEQTFRGITWATGSEVDTSDKSITIRGKAAFSIEKQAYNEFLNYHYNKANNTMTYTDQSGKVLFRNTPVYESVKDENGTYSITFKGPFSGLHYRITNRDTGEAYTGVLDKNQMSQTITTEKPARYDFDIVWITAK